MRYVLYPPRLGCEEVQRLKNRFKERGLHCFIAKRDGEYRPQESDLIIGWGYSRHPIWEDAAKQKGAKWLNHCSKIKNSVNKLETFELLQEAGVDIPRWTQSKERAKKWLNSGKTILARSTATACKGEGITVVKPGEVLPDALFYTVFIPNTKEFRVYVCDGKVIDVLEKRKIQGFEGTPNQYVRGSEESGWCFCRQGVFVDEEAKRQSIEAIEALGLTFGGVDVLVGGEEVTILEVNTAPDIFGTGVDRFVDAFVKIGEAV